MNDLTLYNIRRPNIQAGDIIAFGGTGFVSNAIKRLTGSALSHVGMVLETSLLIDGKPQDGRVLSLIESTTLTGVSGVQINRLSDRIAAYDPGGRVWHLSLSDWTRKALDFPAMWDFALRQRHDQVKYDYAAIGAFIAREIPLLGKLPVFHRPDPKRVVCSEFCAEVLRAGGLPGLDVYEISPQRLAEMHIYRDCVQLVGEPQSIRSFNTK